jgi:hypothetical protein
MFHGQAKIQRLVEAGILLGKKRNHGLWRSR